MNRDGIKVVTDSMGFEIEENINTGNENESTRAKNTVPTFTLEKAIDIICLEKKLIPEGRIGDNYNRRTTEANVNKMAEIYKFDTKFLVEYLDKLDSILYDIKGGIKLKGSYIIGAPNGYSKTTFANTCIKYMEKRKMAAVPYVSLFEMAELRLQHERMLLGNLEHKLIDYSDTAKYYEKTPKICIGSYSWSEYMTADILFIYFTVIESKVIESKTLQAILSIRGDKGLPTVAFISTSMNQYYQDPILSKYVWSEIINNGDKLLYDRVKHSSTFKINQKLYN